MMQIKTCLLNLCFSVLVGCGEPNKDRDNDEVWGATDDGASSWGSESGETESDSSGGVPDGDGSAPSTDSGAYSDTATGTDSDTATGTDVDTATGADSDADADTDTDADADADADTDAETGTDTEDTEADSDADADEDVDSDSSGDTDTESITDDGEPDDSTHGGDGTGSGADWDESGGDADSGDTDGGDEDITDDDGDGFSEADGDCDDTAVVISPLATDIVGDGIDQNCDGVDGTDMDTDGYASMVSGGTDCDDTDILTGPPTEWYDDADSDGHGSETSEPILSCDSPSGKVAATGDCDDGDVAIFPGGPEICDGLDNNCDGVIEEGFCPSGFLPETGLSACFDETDEIACPSMGEPFFGQDGNIVRADMSLLDHGDGTVTEAVTGLTWQKELADETYTWWDAHTYCEELELAGSTDWRLPNRLEAMSVVDYSLFSPALPAELPTEDRVELWVSAEAGSGSAIYLWAENGGCYNNPKHNLYGVRCVRGERDPQEWTHHGDGTMEDTLTQRMWTRTHDGVVRNWSQALDYCQSLELAGFTNWRLPDIKELRSTLYSPVPSIHYWSSTTDLTHPEEAWITVSGTRGTYTQDKSTTYWQVICTRESD